MNNLILECIEAIEDDMDDGYLVDEDSRLKFALRYLANDEEISELYELIKTGKAPGAGKQSGAFPSPNPRSKTFLSCALV